MKAKKNLTFFDRVLLWINIFFSISLLVSYLAPVTDPQKNWLIPFFGLAYPILLLANVIMIIYWLLRRKLWALLPFICIAVGWTVLCNNIGLRLTAEPTRTPNTVRMMTYNVHEFKRYGANNDISTKREILRIITEQQPDIINFQEYYSRTHGQYDMSDSIMSIMKTNHYFFQKSMYNSSEANGIAIFSKLPIIAHGMIVLSDFVSENQCVFVDVKLGNRPFRVYNVHLQSVGFDNIDYVYLNKVSKQGKADMSGTKRLGSKLKNAFEKRSEQVAKLKKDAAACPYPYIIAGDFNDTPTSFCMNEIAKGLKNAFREKGSGMGRTYNGDFPNYQIDYIMASPAFDVTSYKIIEKKLSDHYTVRSDLVLK